MLFNNKVQRYYIRRENNETSKTMMLVLRKAIKV